MIGLKAAAVVIALALGGVLTSASATTFDFSFTSTDGTGNSATGNLVATPNGDGSFTADSGTITGSGPGATGSGTLLSNPNAPNADVSPTGLQYDDQLFPGRDPLLSTDFNGIAFAVGADEFTIVAGSAATGRYFFFDNDAGRLHFFSGGDFTLTEQSAVPEPSTWALLLIGFGSLGTVLRTSRRQRAIAPLH